MVSRIRHKQLDSKRSVMRMKTVIQFKGSVMKV